MDIDDAYLEVLIEMDIDDLEDQTVDNDDLFSTPESNRGMNPSVGCSSTIDKGKGKSALGGNGKGCFKRTKREYLAQFRRQRNIISMPQRLSAATANKTKAAFRPNGSSRSSYRNDVRVMASPRTETEEVSEATAHRPDEKMGSRTSDAQSRASLERRQERVRIMEEIFRLLGGKLVFL